MRRKNVLTNRYTLVRACMERKIATEEEARIVLSHFLHALTAHLEAGRFIEIRGFGSLFSKRWKARKTVTRHGEFATPSRLQPRFRPSQELKRAIQEAYHARRA